MPYVKRSVDSSSGPRRICILRGPLLVLTGSQNLQIPAHVFLSLGKDLIDMTDSEGDVEQDVSVGGGHILIENVPNFCNPPV